MQQFTVPQFIDVEDKIIGPITTRQFLIFLAGAILIGIFYKIFSFDLFIVLSVIVFIISVTFGFVKINGRPFHFFVLNFIQTLRRPKIRVWNHRLAPVIDKEKIPTLKFEETRTAKEYYKKSKIAELSLIVDTEGEYKGSDNEDDDEFINY